MTAEIVLLRAPSGGEPFVATIPAGASLHTVPRRDGIPPSIRGLTFERTGHVNDVLELAVFRKRARQA